MLGTGSNNTVARVHDPARNDEIRSELSKLGLGDASKALDNTELEGDRKFKSARSRVFYSPFYLN